MNLESQIESILFVAAKPLSVRTIAKAIGRAEAEVVEIFESLRAKYADDASGFSLITNGAEVQLGTKPENAAAVDGFVKDEAAGELTRAQLETLTVIAYRGPVTRPELEQIRGVNCALILRSLLIRGYIEEYEEATSLTTVYRLSLEAMRHLGVASPEELPDYAALHAHEYIEAALRKDDQNPSQK